MKEPNNSQCTTLQTCPIYASLGRSSELQSRSNCSQKSAEQSRRGETSGSNSNQATYTAILLIRRCTIGEKDINKRLKRG